MDPCAIFLGIFQQSESPNMGEVGTGRFVVKIQSNTTKF